MLDTPMERENARLGMAAVKRLRIGRYARREALERRILWTLLMVPPVFVWFGVPGGVLAGWVVQSMWHDEDDEDGWVAVSKEEMQRIGLQGRVADTAHRSLTRDGAFESQTVGQTTFYRAMRPFLEMVLEEKKAKEEVAA